MTSFTYIGGKESDGTDLPGIVTIFSHEFRLDTPTEIRPDLCGGDAKAQHAIDKLRKHPQFVEAIDEPKQRSPLTDKKSGKAPDGDAA